MNQLPARHGGVPVVLIDANVMYQRVLRDYLLYASEQEIISTHWSQKILDEANEHLIENRPDYTQASANRLNTALTDAYPDAMIEPTSHDFGPLEGLALPDEDDRHVIAAAIKAEADIIVTDDKTGFPEDVLNPLGIIAMTSDELLTALIYEHLPDMVEAHHITVAYQPYGSDGSTINALHHAKAHHAARFMAVALGIPDPWQDETA